MFVISVCNLFVTDQGLGGGTATGATRLTWPTLEDAHFAAYSYNERYGMNAYVHPADRTDLCLASASTFDWGYAD